MLQQVTTQKTDGNAGAVIPGADGILAIIAAAPSGTQNQAGVYGSMTAVKSDFPSGRLVEAASFVMNRAKKPVVLVRAAASTNGAYSSITKTGTGTSVMTAGSSFPSDDFVATVEFLTGGTIGVAGITYRYTLDGLVWTGPIALGVANTIALMLPPSLTVASGAGLALGAGTIVAGDKATFTTTAPVMNNADLVAALEALRLSTLRYEAVLVDGVSDATQFGAAGTWRAARDGDGRFYSFIENTRYKTSVETEAAYKTALDTVYGAVSDIGTMLCADGFDAPSQETGLTLRRPTSWFAAARGMSRALAEDISAPAYGPADGLSILDSKGASKYHNEEMFPTLDDAKYVTMRTFAGETGFYITNPNLFSPLGSDWYYWQYARLMNRALEITGSVLRKRLSLGIDRVQDSVLPIIRISEEDAVEIEGLVREAILKDLRGQVTDAGYSIVRTDDIGGLGPVTINGDTWIVPKAYPKKFAVKGRLLRAAPVTVSL